MKKLFKTALLTFVTASALAQITGSGTGSSTFGYVPRFNTATSVTNSNIYQGSSPNNYVGVGITTPGSPLHVKFNVNSNNGIRVDQQANAASALILNHLSARNWQIWSTGPGNAEGAGQFIIRDNTSAAGRMMINTAGNILIGDPLAIAPLTKLHVHDGAIRITGTAPGLGGPNLIFGGNATTAVNGEWGLEYETANVGFEGLNFWKPFGSSGISGNHYLFLHNNGRVGINTNNTTAQLTVNGNVLIGDPSNVSVVGNYKLFVQTGILTEKVKVALTSTTDWADYVFESNYQLAALEDVKSFVDANKHLPNVPSAQELKNQGGIDLGKMDAKLMEKIEELTLYVIQLHEENKCLQERINKIESKK